MSEQLRREFYGIWCPNDPDGDYWLRPGMGDGHSILAFESELKARERAAAQFCFPTYEEAMSAGWCEVRPLSAATPRDKLLEEMAGLLKKAGEVIDDDLENRPARHSLGGLHAGIKAALASYAARGK